MATVTCTAFDELCESGRLPGSHGIASELMAYLLPGGEEGAARLLAIASADAPVARFLVRLASLDAQPGVVPTVAQACEGLGVSVCSRAALGNMLIDQYRYGPCKCFDYEAFWSRSLATGVAAYRLAQRDRAVSPNEAFLAGLLGQVGRLGLATVHPGTYARLLAFCGNKGAETLARLEREKYGLDHNDVTAAMLAEWGASDDIARAAGAWDTPSSGADERDATIGRLVPVLRLAGQMASICMASAGRRAFMAPKLVGLSKAVSVDVRDLPELFDRAVMTWRDWADELALPSHEVPGLVDLWPSLSDEDAAASGDASADGAAPELKTLPEGLRLLVVDDCELTRMLIRKQLSSLGHEIDTATDGADGLAALGRGTPHIVITDWEMPRLNGIEFCRSLRQAINGRRIYVIMMSGHESQDDLEQAFEAGADDYLIKPVTSKQLSSHIHKARETLARRQRV